MSRLDWNRASARDRVSRQGADDVSDFGLPAGLLRPAVRPSKAAAQKAAAEAIARSTQRVACACGHSADVLIPNSRREARLRCTRCGSLISAVSEGRV